MASSTIGFVDMKNIPSQAEFMGSLKASINALIDESYLEHGVDKMEPGSIPIIRNQARLSEFDYDVSGGRYERFIADFSIFVAKEDFSSSQANKKFKVKFGDDSAEKVTIPNEGRGLYILPNCMDYSEAFEGPKMVLSIGNWGKSAEIITRILEDFGAEYYFAQDDCTVEYEKRVPKKAA